VLGKQAGTTLGAMVLRTGSEDAPVDGTPGEAGATFEVARWRQDVLKESSIGLIGIGRQGDGRSSGTLGADGRYGTSTLFGHRNMETGFAIARTSTGPGATGAGSAERLYVNFPNDQVQLSASWTRADSAFDPPVGYVRRNGFQAIASRLSFNPRPKSIPLVKQLQFKLFDGTLYLNDGSTSLQSFKAETIPLGVWFKTGEHIEVNVQRQADRPLAAFDVVPGATIDPGTYWWSRAELQIETFEGRALSGSMEINGGGYYRGQRHELGFNGKWKTSRFLTVSGYYQRNRIDLDDKAFNVRETGGRLDLAISPNLFGAVAGQWNSEDDQAILNFRLNWIPEPGSDLFLVINQQIGTQGSWFSQHTTVLTKLIWRVAL
jgi:hypothetical protein